MAGFDRHKGMKNILKCKILISKTKSRLIYKYNLKYSTLSVNRHPRGLADAE